MMDQQNLIALRDVLSTLPGITFGAGEGGGGYGDSINLRGFSANSDITVDGVRDSAQYSRTDTFNLEAIELVNGANSVYSGAGSVGGNINLVSKAAREGDFSSCRLGAGTDGYGRMTARQQHRPRTTAPPLRLNAMVHQNDAPGRDYEKFERWGVAPSVAFGLGSRHALHAELLAPERRQHPAVRRALLSRHGGPLPGVDPSNYYGYRNIDSRRSTSTC